MRYVILTFSQFSGETFLLCKILSITGSSFNRLVFNNSLLNWLIFSNSSLDRLVLGNNFLNWNIFSNSSFNWDIFGINLVIYLRGVFDLSFNCIIICVSLLNGHSNFTFNCFIFKFYTILRYVLNSSLNFWLFWSSVSDELRGASLSYIGLSNSCIVLNRKDWLLHWYCLLNGNCLLNTRCGQIWSLIKLRSLSGIRIWIG